MLAEVEPPLAVTILILAGSFLRLPAGVHLGRNSAHLEGKDERKILSGSQVSAGRVFAQRH